MTFLDKTYSIKQMIKYWLSMEIVTIAGLTTFFTLTGGDNLTKLCQAILK